MLYDVLIAGAGPAGLTAAVYARRAGKTVLLVEQETFGGQITFSPRVENFPGIVQASGSEIGEKLLEQAMNQGAQLELDRVVAAKKIPEGFALTGESGTYTGRTLIVAAGSRHRTLGLPGEERFTGAGISYCAVCDGAFYAGKNVTVVGGGNSALQEAVALAEICAHVTVVQNLAFLTGEPGLAEKLKAAENVDILYNATVSALLGAEKLTGVMLQVKDAPLQLQTDGLFVAIGQQPDNGPFAELCSLDSRGFVLAGEDCCTGTPGVFAAGDCRTKRIRQAVTACGDGAVAALAACRYAECLSVR